MSAPATPPLSPQEVRRVLHRLQELTDEGRTVVVGGQAVYFWAYYFSSRHPTLLRGAPPTSKDLDLCGNRDTVLRAAELLGGEALLPSIDRHTPNAGVVRFRDADGHDRLLDVITQPYGLTKRAVVQHAVRVRYQPSRSRAVHFWVMNPVHCMQSRVKNVVGLGQRSRHGLRQLRVSIPCAREFLRSLLDTKEVDLALRRRRVMSWNQRIYRFARSDDDSQVLYRELGIDPFDAVLVDDERLSDRFRRDGYPRWKGDLDRRRAAAKREVPFAAIVSDDDPSHAAARMEESLDEVADEAYQDAFGGRGR